MSFRQFYPSCRVPSRSSSSPSPPLPPPSPFVCTPPNGKSELKLLPTPPLSTSSQKFQEQVDLVWRALHYINNRTSESPGLLINDFSWADFDDFQDELNHPRTISGKSADSLRYDYNPETLTLRIPPMPKAPHEELVDYLHKILNRFCRLNLITEAEELLLHLGAGKNMPLPYRATTAQHGRKAPAFAKQPDAYIGLKDNGITIFPRVVFEVGFSQSYDEVMDDVNQWLVRSEGRIPLVVLIFIEEHPIVTADADGDDDDDQHSDDSADSDVNMYERFRETCNVDLLVGPLSAFAELYRLGPTGVYRVGARINIISPSDVVPAAAPGHIVLSITDLLPDVHDGRVLDFDLALYASGLQESRGHMALERILEARRRRKKAAARVRAVDPDFAPVSGKRGNRGVV